ncbi:mechanosensitive ion channel domain-containing protein [Salinisphaera sp. T31B1]|uniref:mechanosensitive ion channel family protein n=1 Tax=Salinisphaera sp. T31B1 TaxID=727963 RepID=UPI0033406F2C
MTDSTHSWLADWALTLLYGLGAALAVLGLYCLMIRLARHLTERRELARQSLDDCAYAGGAVVFLLVLQTIWQAHGGALPWIEAVRHITSLCLILALTWAAMRGSGAIGDVIVGLNPAVEGRHRSARKLETQARFISRGISVLIAIIGVAAALMTFPSIRQLGTSLLASAGIGGLILGFAARPVIGNLFAGLQIALSQPFRIEDVLKVEGNWCWVEDITTTYVVLRAWDMRRIIVPLQWFIENPFENWTRDSTHLFAPVLIWVDYRLPVEPVRQEFQRLLDTDGAWDGRVGHTQVVEASETAMQLRFLLSAADSITLWHFRCRVREAMLDFIQREYPQYLPRIRAHVFDPDESTGVVADPFAAPWRE